MPKNKLNVSSLNTGCNPLFVVLQNPVSGELKSVPYDEYINAVKQAIIRQERRQHTLFVTTLTSNHKIGSYKIENGQANLYLRFKKLQAEIIFKDSQQNIVCSNIVGISQELLLKPEYLPYYLKNACARLAKLSDDSYKLYLTPKLLGGLSWWEWALIGVVAIAGGTMLVAYAFGAGATAAAALATTATETATTAATIAEAAVAATATAETVAAATAATAAAEAAATAASVAAAKVVAAKTSSVVLMFSGLYAGYKSGEEKYADQESLRAQNMDQQQTHTESATTTESREELRMAQEQLTPVSQQNDQLRKQGQRLSKSIESKDAKIDRLTRQVANLQTQAEATNDDSSDDDTPAPIQHRQDQRR